MGIRESSIICILYRAFFCWSSEWEEWKQKAGLVVAVLTLLLYIYIYKTETFKTPTIFHVSIIKKKNFDLKKKTDNT